MKSRRKAAGKRGVPLVEELVVISGKGGTGKTSIVAAFANLAWRVALADCDVDASDLHLILSPEVRSRENFSGGSRARILSGHCTACGKCEEICRFDAVFFDGPGNGKVEKTYRIDPISCEGCGVCVHFCAEGAIEFAPAINGEWYRSETRFGPMVHAKLGVAEENSGKLVSLVRKEAGRLAEEKGLKLLLIDGSPGIGCPVIASVTGADRVLIVTEPTLSGLHDLERVADLTRHFGIPALLCVNRWDINEGLTQEIENTASNLGVKPVGRVRYDRAVTQAQTKGLAVTEFTEDGASKDIRKLWENVRKTL